MYGMDIWRFKIFDFWEYFEAKLVQLRMDVIIWGNSTFSAQRGVHWDIQFFPVQDVPTRKVISKPVNMRPV